MSDLKKWGNAGDISILTCNTHFSKSRTRVSRFFPQVIRTEEEDIINDAICGGVSC